MTRKITDAELGNIDGGLDQIQQNPPDLAPKDLVDPDTGDAGGAGGGIADDIQQNNDRPGSDT